MRLILDNLLSNAIKFTPRGGTISIHARERARTAGARCHGLGSGHSRRRSATGYSRRFIRARRLREATSRAPESAFGGDRIRQCARREHRDPRSRPPAARIFGSVCRCAIPRPPRVKRLMRHKLTDRSRVPFVLCALGGCALTGRRRIGRQESGPAVNPSASRRQAAPIDAVARDDERAAAGGPGAPSGAIPVGQRRRVALADHDATG